MVSRLVIENARVMGSYENTCVVVEGERIVDVGGSQVCEKYRHNSKVIDVEGKVVLPGLIDTHLHLESIAYMYDWIDLRDTRSIDELKEALRLWAKRTSDWVLGRGWDHELFREKRLPTRHDLDEAVPDKPVLVIRVCGHVAVANTKALRIAGLLDKIPEKYKHLVDVDENSKPTGILYEDAIWLVRSKVPKPSLDELSIKLQRVLRKLSSYGITTVNSMAASLDEYYALRKLLEENSYLPVRVRLFLSMDAFEKIGLDEIELYRNNPWLSIRGLKVFSDGSFGARTAALKQGYSDDPGNKGKLLLDSTKIVELSRRLAAENLLLAVHAIGDRAVEEAAKAIIEANANNVRIEHASLTPPETVELLVKAKPYAITIQPHFTVSDWWIKDRLGERAVYVYAFKTLANAGLVLAGSSDAPVEPVNPWLGISALLTRGNLGDLNPWEALNVDEAVEIYTSNAATASGDYGRIGLIKRDYYADLIVVDENPWVLGKNDIAGIRPVLVIVGGKIVYEAPK